jgi:hypothetical protein
MKNKIDHDITNHFFSEKKKILKYSQHYTDVMKASCQYVSYFYFLLVYFLKFKRKIRMLDRI